MMPCNLIDRHQCFGGNCYHHLLGARYIRDLVPIYQTVRRQKIAMLTVKSGYDGVSRSLAQLVVVQLLLWVLQVNTHKKLCLHLQFKHILHTFKLYRL
jgi:hypothetical protein